MSVSGKYAEQFQATIDSYYTCHGLWNCPSCADSIITTKSASNNDVISIAGLDQTCYTPSFEALTDESKESLIFGLINNLLSDNTITCDEVRKLVIEVFSIFSNEQEKRDIGVKVYDVLEKIKLHKITDEILTKIEIIEKIFDVGDSGSSKP